MKRSCAIFLIIAASGAAFGTVFRPDAWAANKPPERLIHQLERIRDQVIDLEKNLVETSRNQKMAKANVKRLQELIKLQKQERELGMKRLTELEGTVKELESRRQVLQDRIRAHQKSMRQFLTALERSVVESGSAERVRSFHLTEIEKVEAPRRKLLASLTNRSLKEIEILRVDLQDADQLEARIQEERQQLAYIFQDLREKEGLLELNRQMQADLLEKHQTDRMAQLENYRKLKSAESQVENLLSQFNARLELERASEAERVANKAMSQGVFAQLKGKLPLPVGAGKVVSTFGRAFDPKSRLYIFKKGVEIDAGKQEKVQAISAGKVAYSGELPGYGRVTIVDHGDHYYSLCAHLGELTKKAGEAVAAGDAIGLTDESGTPVYFEIRARNVAVNPLQWVAN